MITRKSILNQSEGKRKSTAEYYALIRFYHEHIRNTSKLYHRNIFIKNL